MNPSANVNADLKVNTAKSQSVLVLLIVVGLICYVSGFAFMWYEKPGYWVPLILGSLIFTFVFHAWYKAQNDTDLENSLPTSINDCFGNSVSTDMRALKSPEFVQVLHDLFSVGANREPLPEPDGLVNEQGKPIPNSRQEASKAVTKVNSEAEILAKAIQSEIGVQNEPKYEFGQIDSEKPFEASLRDTNEKI